LKASKQHVERHGSQFCIGVYIREVVGFIISERWNTVATELKLTMWSDALRGDPYLFLKQFEEMLPTMYASEIAGITTDVNIDCPASLDKNESPFSDYCCQVVEHCRNMCATPATTVKALVRGLRKNFLVMHNQLDAYLKRTFSNDSLIREDTIKDMVLAINRIAPQYFINTPAIAHSTDRGRQTPRLAAMTHDPAPSPMEPPKKKFKKSQGEVKRSSMAQQHYQKRKLKKKYPQRQHSTTTSFANLVTSPTETDKST
jgi:hypothetical protein